MSAGGRRGSRPLAGRADRLARAVLASGLLPVFHARAANYRPGPLQRADASPRARDVARGWPPAFRARAGRIGASVAAWLGLGTLAAFLALSRARARFPAPAGWPALTFAALAGGIVAAVAVALILPERPPSVAGRDPVSAAQYRVAWPFEIADGLTFGPEGAVKTRLAGLEGPTPDAICNDGNGQPWACGLQARAALNELGRRGSLLCEPVGPPSDGAVPARCSGEVDLARELVLAGFARPVGPDPALEGAVEEARRDEKGLWNGGWTIRTSIR